MAHGRTTQVVTELCDGMAVVPGVGRKVTRNRRSVVLPSVCSINKVGNHNHNLLNSLRAIKERVFCVQQGGHLVAPPAPVPDAFVPVSLVMSEVAKYIGPRHPLTTGQFVAQCASGKRKLYEAAARKLASNGITFRDARIKAFVKNEKIMFADSGSKADPAPRIIQPRSPTYNVALGRYTRAVEHDIYEALAHVCKTTDNSPVVMKGMTPAEVAKAIRDKWEQFSHPVAVGIDASRFDQHVSQDALRCEHGCYNAIFNSKELEWLLRQQLVTNGVVLCDDKKLV